MELSNVNILSAAKCWPYLMLFQICGCCFIWSNGTKPLALNWLSGGHASSNRKKPLPWPQTSVIITHVCFPARHQCVGQDDWAPFIRWVLMLPEQLKVSASSAWPREKPEDFWNSFCICSFLLTRSLEFLLWEELERVHVWGYYLKYHWLVFASVGEMNFRAVWPEANISTEWGKKKVHSFYVCHATEESRATSVLLVTVTA